MKFVDMDRYIEEKTGLKVREIFDRFGEAHFPRSRPKRCAHFRRVRIRGRDRRRHADAPGKCGGSFTRAAARSIFSTCRSRPCRREAENDRRRPLCRCRTAGRSLSGCFRAAAAVSRECRCRRGRRRADGRRGAPHLRAARRRGCRSAPRSRRGAPAGKAPPEAARRRRPAQPQRKRLTNRAAGGKLLPLSSSAPAAAEKL